MISRSNMTAEEIKLLIEDAIEHHHQIEAVTKDLYPSKVWTVVIDLCESHVKQVAHRIGDKKEWLEWFMYENDFGARGFEASPGDEHPMRKIETIDDLVWLIEESK